jgi:hypothetical protein
MSDKSVKAYHLRDPQDAETDILGPDGFRGWFGFELAAELNRLHDRVKALEEENKNVCIAWVPRRLWSSAWTVAQDTPERPATNE